MKFNNLKINSEIEFCSKKFIIVSLPFPKAMLKRLDDNEILEVNYYDLVAKSKVKIDEVIEAKEIENNTEGKTISALIPDKKRNEVYKYIKVPTSSDIRYVS